MLNATAPMNPTVLNVMGTRCQTLISGEQTGGQFTSVYVEVDDAGVGVPEHIHAREDEVFHILSGRVRFTLGDEVRVAGPGETVYGPRGRRHSWFAEEPCCFVVSATPSGLETMFAEMDATDPAVLTSEVAALCRRYGIEFTPPVR